MHASNALTVRVKPEVANRLQKLAELMERPKSYLAAEAIEEYLDIHEWQVQAIEAGIAAAKKGDFIEFEEVKKRWRKKFEDKAH